MKTLIIALALLGILSGCTTLPSGPSVAVMPAPGKPFDVFVAEDRECRQFAQQSIGTTANKAATESAEKSIAVGTAIGAVAGTLLSDSRSGAGSGAAIGMLGGASAGSDAARYSGNELQRRYDIAYQQCMYAKGNQIPRASDYQPRTLYSPPPAPNNPPPPSEK